MSYRTSPILIQVLQTFYVEYVLKLLKQQIPCNDHKQSDSKTELILFENGVTNPEKHYLW